MEVENMKYTQLIIGLVLFSGVLFALFFAAAEIGRDYQSDDYGVYEGLSKTYKNNTEYGTETNGTLKTISAKLDAAEFSVVSAAVGAIDSVLQAAKLMKDSVGTIGRVADQIQEDSKVEIHPIIPIIIKSIISIVLIIIILIVFLKMKPET